LDWLTWLPFSGIIACLAGWGALSAALTPQEAAAANYANLLDSIHTTLWTGLFGKTLNQTAWLVVVFFLIVAVVGIFTTRMRVAVQPLTPVQRWSRVGLYAFLFFDLAWYAFISIGWVRYAFAGLFMAALVSGEPHWELIKVVSRGLKPRLAWAKPERLALVACIGLFGFGVANHLVVVAVSPGSGDAVQMANTIQELVPQHALVESWEWELDFLSGDRVYHHPTQNYLFLAIRQRFHENAAFTLGYNALQADPDYLVVGPFADWTTIYADALSGQDFQEVRQVGVYTLYKRVR
jgi:hypothetical protein